MENSTVPPTNPFDEVKTIAPLQNKFLEIGRSGKNQWWRYLLGILIVFIATILFTFFLEYILSIYGKSHGYNSGTDGLRIMNLSAMHINANIILLIKLSVFVGAMFGLWITVKFLHKKKFISIITSTPKIRWKRFGISALVWMILCFAGLFISMIIYPNNFKMVFNLQPFLITLLIGILFLPFQTWWEEYFFRGYLFQGIGLLTKTPVVPILITGTLFGLVHMTNPEVAAYGLANTLPAYIMPGIFLAMIAALDEGLESAMGWHFAQNLFLTFAVTNSNNEICAYTIWVEKTKNLSATNLQELISFFILIAILAKTNKWKFSKLYQ